MTVTPLEAELLENDKLRQQLAAMRARVQSHVGALRASASQISLDPRLTDPVRGTMTATLLKVADLLEQDLKRWETAA